MHTAELGLLTEGLGAFSAADPPRPAALALGSLPAGLWEEARVMSGALGRPLPLVQKVVAEQGAPVMEAHVTVRALQRALPCVCGQMSKQTLL